MKDPMTAAETPTTSCPRCAVLLATDAVEDGTTILCAACGQPFLWRPLADTRKTSRKAVASLVLGTFSIFFWCLAGVPAIVLGVLALMEIRQNEGRLKGRKAAVAGILISCVLGVVCIPLAPIALPLVMRAARALQPGQ
jgi:uncharacterized paraquat-inducible protein A